MQKAKDWNIVKLKEIGDVKGGKRLPKGEPFSETKTNHPYLRVVDFRNNGIDEKNLEYVSDKIFTKIKNYAISSNDVYISIAGTIGLTGLIPKHLDGANLTENAAKITNLKNILKEYLSIVLSSKIVQDQIKSYLGTTSQPKLALFRIEKLEFPLPRINEQEKIVSILSNVDYLISSYDDKIQTTKKLKQGLMQQLLTKGIGHKKFKKTKLGIIPEEWELENLGNLCQIRKNNNCQSELYVGLEHISQGTNLLVGRGHTSNFSSTKNIFKRGDVLYGKLRPILNKVWLAKEDGFCSTDILPIETNERLDNQILVKIISSKEFVLFASSTSGGTKMPRTNWSDIKKYQIRLPPIHEQQKIASIFSSVDDKITELESKKKSLESLKRGLMQKLLTGQIRVAVPN